MSKFNKIYGVSEVNAAYIAALENKNGFIIVESDDGNRVYIQHSEIGNGLVVIKDRKSYEICDPLGIVEVMSL